MSDNQLFKPEIRNQLQQVLSSLNREQLLWLGGYISAAIDFAPSPATSIAEPPRIIKETGKQTDAIVEDAPKPLTILYGSHSGNSQKVATMAHQEAQQRGWVSKLLSMDDYNAKFLKNEQQLLIVVSTHGEGEPPLAAQELYEALSGKNAPGLNGIPFSVIALGDSSYKLFCKTGVDFYNFLKVNGGKPLGEVVMFDTTFEIELPLVIPSVLNRFSENGSANGGQNNGHKQSKFEVAYVNADTPVDAPVVNKLQLNGRGSEKETWHVEISTEENDLDYQPGDVLEVFVNNKPELVNAIIQQLGFNKNDKVEIDSSTITLESALTNYFELTVVTPQVVKKYATLLSDASLNKLLDNSDELDAFLKGTDVLDIVTKYPVSVTPQEFLSVLRRLPPRAYSIASSKAEVGDEVHITVGTVRFEKENRLREGVCSTYIADRLGEDGTLKVRIKTNRHFKLPANNHVPVIMVGAGTGVAPFRGFLQHRSATGAKGKNWLIFGDRHFATDFLYQAEWLKYKKSGLLSRLDVAFSRDQEEKRYVQHKLKKNGKKIFKWITEGAHFYVCGDMKKMAVDVKNAFMDIIQIEGNMSRNESEKFLSQLRKEGRYQEDVY